MNLGDLINDFQGLGDSTARLEYIIELGRGLPPFPDSLKTEENLVRGCASQVWLKIMPDGQILAMADAKIVNGLLFIIITAFKAGGEVDADELLGKLGLEGQISSNRLVGFKSVVEQIKRG